MKPLSSIPAAIQALLSAAASHSADTQLVRRSRLVAQQRIPFTEAAVLIGLAPDRYGRPHILLTRRADTLRHHRGQIAFPGGKRDAADSDAYATALRETCEETGIAAEVWQYAGCLPSCLTPSGYAITPILAWSDRQPETRANPAEVAELFWLPLAHALGRECYTSRRFVWQNHEGSTPALSYLHHDIWGATALMLYYLAETAEQIGGWPPCLLDGTAIDF